MTTRSDDTPQTWLTQEAFDRLQAELTDLEGPVREDIVRKIESAREEGDLKENGGYHAAKDEQGKIEARIKQLTALLRDAKVGEAPAQADVAGPGTVVEVRYVGDDDTEKFLLGSREDTTGGSLEIYSPASPIGKAVSGHKAGETVSYDAPNGRKISVELVSVAPYVG